MKTFEYWVGRGLPKTTVTITDADLNLPAEELLDKFNIKSSKNYNKHSRFVLEHLRTREGISGKYGLAQLIYLLRHGMTSFHLCECGSGKEVVPKNTTATDLTQFCDVQCPAARKARAESIAETCLDKYGVSNAWAVQDVKDDMATRKLERYGDDVWPNRLKEIEAAGGVVLSHPQEWKGFTETYEWKCNAGHEFKQAIPNGTHPVCRTCSPTTSKAHREIQHFIESLGFSTEENNRSIIKPYELDIVVKSKKIAVEINGVYFHNTDAVGPGYHKMKSDMAEESSYQLIHITDAEWIGKQELVKSRLKAILGVGQTVIYARNCETVALTSKDAKAFCEANHMQGSAPSSINFGLKYKDRVVAVMTFGKSRFAKDTDFELVRLAYLKDHAVVGGASKLLKAFRRQYPSSSLISYCDRRYSVGKVYHNLGFKRTGITPPNYVYVHLDGRTYSRYQAMKHKLPKLLKTFDPEKTEFENMRANGFWKIEDSGNIVYKM